MSVVGCILYVLWCPMTLKPPIVYCVLMCAADATGSRVAKLKRDPRKAFKVISPDARLCLRLSNPIPAELTEAVEGFVGGAAAASVAPGGSSELSADMLATPALVTSVLCKRY